MRRIVLLLSLSCAEQVVVPVDPDGGSETDAGSSIFEPAPIAAPEPPHLDELAPPMMTPCPDGWREVPPAESVFPSSICEPFPSGSEAICPLDQALFPGTEACARVGTECPSDPWASDLPNDRTVVYVSANAVGGNGTRSAPYGSITQAIAATGDGAVIALARGTYDEAVVIDKAVTLWGACVAETLLDESSFAGTVQIAVAGAGLKNLRVAGSDLGIRVDVAGASLVLEDVVIAGATGGGIVVEGAMVTGSRVVIRETFDGSYFGRGLVALAGASVNLTGVELFGNQDAAVISAGMETEVSLHDVTIRDTLAGSSGAYGIGALAGEGGRLTLANAALVRNRDRAIWAYDGGGIAVTDALVRDTRAASDGTDGLGAQSQGGATLSLERTLIDRSRTIGVYVSDSGASAELIDVIIHDTDPQPSDGFGGRGVNAQLGVDLEMTRVLVKESWEMGVFAAADTRATLTDVIIEDVHNVGPVGTGFTLNFGGAATVERMRISRVTQGGIALGEASVLMMSDVLVEDGLGLESDGSEGLGVVVQSGSRITSTRLSVLRCRDQGIFLRDPGTEGTFEDVIVEDVESDAVSGRFGRGIGVEVGARATVRRARFERTTEHGMMAQGSGARLIAEDVRVAGTRTRSLDRESGRALGVQVDAHAEITRALFSDNHEVGVFVSGEAATATLTDVVIERTESRGDGVGGRGLDVSLGGRVTARGIRLADNREFGVVVVNDGSRAELIDAIVTGTRENACPMEECLGFGKGGTGVAAAKNAALLMQRFLVEKSALAGLALTRGGTIDLLDGEVAFNPVGVNIDAEGYNLDRLRDQVRYHDNDLTLQTITLPEPRSSDSIAGELE